MPNEPEKTIFEDLEDAFNEAQKNVSSAAKNVRDSIEDTAATLAIKREEIWKRYQVGDRLTGAALTAKFGLAGLKLAPLTVPLAAMYGFAKGPQIVEKHDKWLEAQKAKRAAANDIKPDGPV